MTGRASSLVLLLLAAAVARSAEQPSSPNHEAVARFLLRRGRLLEALRLRHHAVEQRRRAAGVSLYVGLWPLPSNARPPAARRIAARQSSKKLHHQSKPGRCYR